MTLKPPVHFEWKGNHHGYYGAWFIAFGLFNIYMARGNGALEALMPLWETIAALGGVMILDDVIEHTITADTPLRLFYRLIFGVHD